MISDALTILKNQLNAYLRSISGAAPDDPWEDKVVFLKGDSMDPVSFTLGTVTVLLINLQQENTLHAAERFTRTLADGTRQQVRPDIRLNLQVLFVASFASYEQGLSYLSHIIRYFQGHPLFTRQNAPDLGAGIERLAVELVTLPFAEQNEIWSALRTTYRPSVLYRVSLLVFRDEDATPVSTVLQTRLRIES